MERCVVIGSNVRYTYTEDDRLNVAFPTESMLYFAKLVEPGCFGEGNLVTAKKVRVDGSKREAAQITNSDLLMRWENLTKLGHENVVSYHKIAIQWMHPELSSGRSFIQLDFVMDFSDGTTLHAMLGEMFQAKKTLHVKTLFDFSKQTANGLAYLHRNNIIHGHLQPQHVLVHKSSMNRFQLRLCGLDNFISSYAAFVQRWLHHPNWLAPEVLMIFTEGASVVHDDPCLSALHIIKEMTSMGHPQFPWAKEIWADMLMEHVINLYACYKRTAGMPSPKARLAEHLRSIPAVIFQSGESPTSNEVFFQFIKFLEEVCVGDSANAQQICASLQNHMGHAAPLPKEPDDTLEHVMSLYFQCIRAPLTTELAAEARSFLPPGVPSVPSSTVDGRKADIWSLGRIMEDLALNAFDTSQKMHDHRLDDMGDNTHMMKIPEPEVASYTDNFMPRDFKRTFASCLIKSVDKRPTAEELVNKLVTLEELTYGSTWIYSSQDGVADEKLTTTHRQMLEEIGCTCLYGYCFWRDFVGEGANGYVHKARVTIFGSYTGNKTVAIKGINLSNTRIKQVQQDHIWSKAKEQWRKLLCLKHPHLVTYHKVTIWKVINGASIEIMMDYCEGGDLDKLITQCTAGVCNLSLEAVFNYSAQLATGLQFLHENQFVHGDLKPGNVFMNTATGDTGNRTLRIGDLDGAVRIREDSSKSERRDVAGTGPYMSPEMVIQLFEEEHGDIGFPTDVWSLGCVILDLANCSAGIKERVFYKTVTNVEGKLEGRKIKRQDYSADAFLFQLSQGFRPFISDLIHRDLKDVIQRCLVSACKDRATARLVLELLLCDENGDPR